jgi:hypothetical protein
MIGASGVGKTSLVKRFVQGKFSEKYLSTVGVKIDNKTVDVGGQRVDMMVWDLEGIDQFSDVRYTYARGASGLLVVVDGERRRTLDDALRAVSFLNGTLGPLPMVFVVNKADLEDQWEIHENDIDALRAGGHIVIRGSAKTGLGVNDAFQEIARLIVERIPAPRNDARK